MTYQANALARKNLERRLAPLRGMEALARPPRGWVKAIREALGMTTAQLARRLGVSQPRIVQAERSEVEDSMTLRSLREMAAGLNCRLVYALVPNEPLDDLLRDRASKIAATRLASANHTMKLENQALAPGDLEIERQRLIEQLISGSPRRLWDDD